MVVVVAPSLVSSLWCPHQYRRRCRRALVSFVVVVPSSVLSSLSLCPHQFRHRRCCRHRALLSFIVVVVATVPSFICCHRRRCRLALIHLFIRSSWVSWPCPHSFVRSFVVVAATPSFIHLRRCRHLIRIIVFVPS